MTFKNTSVQSKITVVENKNLLIAENIMLKIVYLLLSCLAAKAVLWFCNLPNPTPAPHLTYAFSNILQR